MTSTALQTLRRSDLETLGLAVATGMVLADSSIVILALPEILREFDVGIASVAWVITSFNLVLALVAVPAALIGRRRPREVCAAGLLVFAAASLVCALAPSFEVLVAARCVQAIGGAAVVCSALELLPRTTGSEAKAVAAWATAGALGAAIGPALGGALTEAISWQAIFLAQTPAALLAIPVLRGPSPTPAEAIPVGRPRIGPNVALGLISAALTAALFLLVLMLIEGWRMTPLQAAATVSVMPLFAFASGRLARFGGSLAIRAAAGAILIGGGLAALGLLPDAGWAWTIAPQALVGLGLGLALSALTERALHGTSPQAVHGGWTMAARHAGVVLGLLALTPIFTAALDQQRDAALESGTAALLDANIDPERKIALGQDIASTIQGVDAELPDLGPAFDQNAPPADSPEADPYAELEATLSDEIDRAATDAFSGSFLLAASFALLALIPIAISRRRVSL